MSINHPSGNLSVRSYVFSLTIGFLKLEPYPPNLKVVFRIGEHSDSVFYPYEDPQRPTQLRIRAQMIHNRQTRSFQTLKALIKLTSVQNDNQVVKGVAELLLNEYMEAEMSGVMHEKQLFNCPDWTAKIGFILGVQEIFQQNQEGTRKNSGDLFINSIVDDKLCQVSILDDSVCHVMDTQNLETLNQLLQDLKQKVLVLEEKVMVLEAEKAQADKLVTKFKQKETIFKRSLKQLQESFQRLRQQLSEKESAYQGLIDTINNPSNADMKQVQSYIICKRCQLLRAQVHQKEKYYEEELQIVEGILKERDQEIIRLHERIGTLEKRGEVLKYKHKQCESYEILINDIFISLRQKAKAMDVSIPELSLSDQLLKVPENLPSIFSNLLGRLQPHFGIVINGVQETESAQRQHLWEQLKKKSVVVSDLQFDLQKAYQKISQLQLQANGYKQERESLMSFGNPKPGDVSFGRKESLLFRRNSDFNDYKPKENSKLEEEIEFLKKRSAELEELLNQQDKLIENITLENAIKTKELQLRMDLEKKINSALQSQAEVERQLAGKDDIINNLKLTIQQYQEDIEELKEKLNKQEPRTRRSRVTLSPNIVEDAALENDLKNLLQSLDKEDQDQEEQLPHTQVQIAVGKSTWQQISPQVKSNLQKKLKTISLEFLRMKSLKVSRCKSKEETQQLMNDFINFRSKLEDAMSYIDNL